MREIDLFSDYNGETTEQLLALEGRYRTDSIVMAIEQALQQKVKRLGMNALSEAEHTVLAVESLEREVNNGGYDSFFRHCPEYVPVIVAALQRISCNDVAILTEKAISKVSSRSPLTAADVEAAMEQDDDERDEELNACDEAYYEMAADFAEPVLKFVRSHRMKIVLGS